MADGAPERRILILGGTTEAAQLARVVERRRGLKVISSLAGRTRDPAPLPGATRSGGFGGIEGLIRFIREEKIDVVIDATHPTPSRSAAMPWSPAARPACRWCGWSGRPGRGRPATAGPWSIR
jgi:precorrin-6A/cobalt-precorrin-6A reductase